MEDDVDLGCTVQLPQSSLTVFVSPQPMRCIHAKQQPQATRKGRVSQGGSHVLLHQLSGPWGQRSRSSSTSTDTKRAKLTASQAELPLTKQVLLGPHRPRWFLPRPSCWRPAGNPSTHPLTATVHGHVGAQSPVLLRMCLHAPQGHS